MTVGEEFSWAETLQWVGGHLLPSKTGRWCGAGQQPDQFPLVGVQVRRDDDRRWPLVHAVAEVFRWRVAAGEHLRVRRVWADKPIWGQHHRVDGALVDADAHACFDLAREPVHFLAVHTGPHGNPPWTLVRGGHRVVGVPHHLVPPVGVVGRAVGEPLAEDGAALHAEHDPDGSEVGKRVVGHVLYVQSPVPMAAHKYVEATFWQKHIEIVAPADLL